jgi:hypothetical protein
MIELKQKYDASTVAIMRRALNEIVTDRLFLVRKSVTTVVEWDPIFGVFNGDSSMPGQMQSSLPKSREA